MAAMMSPLLMAEKWALNTRLPGPEHIHLTVLAITSKQMFSPAVAILQIKLCKMMSSPERRQQSENRWESSSGDRKRCLLTLSVAVQPEHQIVAALCLSLEVSADMCLHEYGISSALKICVLVLCWLQWCLSYSQGNLFDRAAPWGSPQT